MTIGYHTNNNNNPSAKTEMAASNKTAKYAGLMFDYHFQPIAVESLGPANESAIHFLTVLGKKIAHCDRRRA